MIKFYILIWLLFSSLDLFAVSRFENVKTMNRAEGLNNSTIYDVIRDGRGFIWLSTDRGISRYDGFHFRNFPFVENNQSEKTSRSHAISRMYADSDGLLYMQFSQGKMACFDSAKEKYLPVEINHSLAHEKINGIYIVDTHILYIATVKGVYNAEVNRVIQGEEELVRIVMPETPLLKGNISHLCSDDQGNLFFVKDNNVVIHYSMGTRQTKILSRSENKEAQPSCLSVKGDYLWICRKWENPVCYDFKRGTSRTLIGTSGAGDSQLSNTYITGIANVDDTNYYLSTWDGLFHLQFASKNLSEAPVTIDNVMRKEHMNGIAIETKMTKLFWDVQQRILWVGTFGGGAVKVNFNEDVCSRLSQEMSGDVLAMEEDAEGTVWMAIQRKGIWKSTTNSLSLASSFMPWTKGIDAYESYQMYKDKNGNFWLGDLHGGITYMNPLSEETQRYQLLPAGVKNFSGNAREFCLDSRGRLWVVTTQGVLLFDTKTGKSQLVFKSDGKITAVLAITEDKEGNIWLGTNGGLKRIEMESGAVKLVGNYEEQAGLQVDAVSSIYVNSYNQILASYPGKIIRIDGREKDRVENVFSLSSGLTSGHIFCMMDDNNGNTWIGSNSGILTIRNDRNSFYDYSATGCCSSVCRLRDGRLLWADSWGMFYFDPLMVKNQKTTKKLLLSDVWVNGVSVAVDEEREGRTILSSAPDYQEEFVFGADNKDFSFYFSDLQYGMLQRKLAYRLLPDEEWKTCSLEDGIHYNSLGSGKYTLQVKLIYPDASEGETLDIPIVVKAYWWCTIWAFIAYFLLFIGLCAATYYYLMHREKKKLQYAYKEATLHEEIGIVKTQQRENEEIDEMRSAVFVRLMEEIRMPLSMIISPLKELLQEKELSKGLSTKVLVAYRNSMGMKNACDQLLNIYGFVPSNKQVELAPYSIVKVLDAFVFSMNEFLRVHPIQLQYEKKIQKDLEVWISKKDIEQVLQNLLYNAFIHIQYSGVVALIVKEMEENGTRYCCISVVDNGKKEVKVIEKLAINKKELLQTDSSSIELGYAIMEQIMQDHHGSISLRNLEGEGTKVQIMWPIDKSAFEQDEHVTFVESEAQEEVVLPEGGVLIKTLEEEKEIELLEHVEAADTASPERTKRKLLIIEDYKDIRFYLKTLFEKDYTILMAVNGKEGVEIAQKELPDLILCDVMMPVKDGLECCKEIKEGLDTCHIPVIMLTAKVEEDDIIKGLEVGADDYILKPFAPQILKVKVKNLIEGRVNLKQMYTKLLVTPTEKSKEETPDVESKEERIEDPFISTVVHIIEENIQEPDFNVKKLASDLNMSQPTLYRRVKQCTDFTIIELIRGVRMKKAATLLLKKQHPVQEVAEMVGYNDIPTFRKHFVDTYGTTPSTYADSFLIAHS